MGQVKTEKKNKLFFKRKIIKEIMCQKLID